MDFTFAVRQVPILRIVGGFVPELPSARRHPHTESIGETLERILRQAKRRKPLEADPDCKPGIIRRPPVRSRINMRCESAEKFAARLSMFDTQEHMGAEIRRRPLPQDRRLYLVQVERR